MNGDFKKIYIDWLYKAIDQYKVSDDLYRITFPYLDRNNDHIEIFIRIKPDGSFLLTDDGETIGELELSGMNVFGSDKRQRILKATLVAHGVKMDEDHALYVECDKSSLPQKKHMLAQCMIKVSDMFHLGRSNVQSLFIEDVRSFFDKNEIFCMQNISFRGKSGLTTTYDFGIQRSKQAPERLVKVVNNLDTTQAGYITFLWGDTKEARPDDSMLYVFIQDGHKKVSSTALNVMDQYGIQSVLWSQRNDVISKLAA